MVQVLRKVNNHCRFGAPFQYRFGEILDRLQDVGITARWQREVIARRIQENRAAKVENPSTEGSGSQAVQKQQEVYLS